MKFIERKDIDENKWNQRIAENTTENIFCYTWYLDAVAENWGALISDNYNTLLPIPYTTKLGVKRFYQAPFTREYDIFGNDFSWSQALDYLTNNFSHLSFRHRHTGVLKDETTRTNQEVIITDEPSKSYRSNAKRLVKKGHKLFKIEHHNQPTLLIQLFKDTVAHKIDSITESDLILLTNLMNASIETGNGEMLIAKDENDAIVGGGFFLKDKKRITYLKGAAISEAKKSGAMYALIDDAFERYKNSYTVFDFGGSDIENIATFYKKFGATDRIYYNYTLDKTPFWFKALKKIKG